MDQTPSITDRSDTITAARVPLVIWVLLITIVTITLQTLTNPAIMPTVYFVGMMAVHITLYWNVSMITSISRLLYILVQGLIIFSTALLMPEGMPALMIGLIPALIGQSIAIYHRTLAVVVIFGILYFSFCIFTLYTQWYNEMLLFIALLLFMTIVVISYALLFFRQVDARIRTQLFLRDLELAHIKVEELTVANERQRMARDLHDTLAQGLAGLIMQLEAMDAYLAKNNIERAKDIVQKSMTQARHTLAEARNAIDDLRAKSVNGLDFKNAVQNEITRFTSAAGIPIHLNNNIRSALPGKTMEHLLYILRESLTNIARHAKATEVAVDIEVTESGKVKMTIKDNGVGFNSERVGNKPGHYGIIGMRERARIIGGQFSIQSSNQGSHIEVLLQDNQREDQDGEA